MPWASHREDRAPFDLMAIHKFQLHLGETNYGGISCVLLQATTKQGGLERAVSGKPRIHCGHRGRRARLLRWGWPYNCRTGIGCQNREAPPPAFLHPVLRHAHVALSNEPGGSELRARLDGQ